MMPPHQFQLGAATITLLHLGDLAVRLADWLRLDQADWPPEHVALFAAPITVPVQCAHIALAGRSVLVDACHPELLGLVGDLPPDAAPAPGLLEQLAAAGIAPDLVDALVITHPHFDHYCGMIAAGATPQDDRLLFPQARRYLGRADWAHLQGELADPASAASRAFGLARRHGLLELVDGDGVRDLGDGIAIVPTPGETPGHQAVRATSQGQTLYVLGDLYHHQVEVERPEWGVFWADAAAVARSRALITARALAEQALLIAAHIPGVGRLAQVGGRVRWEG